MSTTTVIAPSTAVAMNGFTPTGRNCGKNARQKTINLGLAMFVTAPVANPLQPPGFVARTSCGARAADRQAWIPRWASTNVPATFRAVKAAGEAATTPAMPAPAANDQPYFSFTDTATT